jgi:hypothetical protein
MLRGLRSLLKRTLVSDPLCPTLLWSAIFFSAPDLAELVAGFHAGAGAIGIELLVAQDLDLDTTGEEDAGG